MPRLEGEGPTSRSLREQEAAVRDRIEELRAEFEGIVGRGPDASVEEVGRAYVLSRLVRRLEDALAVSPTDLFVHRHGTEEYRARCRRSRLESLEETLAEEGSVEAGQVDTEATTAKVSWSGADRDRPHLLVFAGQDETVLREILDPCALCRVKPRRFQGCCRCEVMKEQGQPPAGVCESCADTGLRRFCGLSSVPGWSRVWPRVPRLDG